MGHLGRSPLQQPAVRDEAAVPDPHNGIQGQPRPGAASSAASTTARSRSCASFEREKLFSPWRVVAMVKGCARGWKSSCMPTTSVAIHASPGRNQPGGHAASPGWSRAAGCGAGCRGSSSGRTRRAGLALVRLQAGERAARSSPRSASRRESSDVAGCCSSGTPAGIHHRARYRWPGPPGREPLRSGRGSAPTLRETVPTARG